MDELRVENNHRARAAGFAPPFCASFCASLQLQLRAPATLHYASTTSLLHFASTVTVPGERSNTRTFCLKIANFCKFLCNLKSFWNCASHTLDHLYKSRVCIFCASRSSPFAPPKTLPLAHLYKSRCAFFCASLMPNKRTHFKPKVCNKVVGVWETVS